MISVLLEFLKTTLFIAVDFARLVLPGILRRANYAIIEFIHRNIRVTRVNNLIRVITLNAAVMASGSLAYLMGCGMEWWRVWSSVRGVQAINLYATIA
jgi:hypothetical protein